MLRLCLTISFVLLPSISEAQLSVVPTRLNDVQLDESLLRVHFIDVGAGLAILIETPGDRLHMFVDGGDQG